MKKTLLEFANKYMYEKEEDIFEEETEDTEDSLPETEEDEEIEDDSEDSEEGDVDGSDISSDESTLEALDQYVEFMENQDKTFISVVTDQTGATHKIDDLARREQIYYMLINDAKDRRKLIRAGEETEDDITDDIEDLDVDSDVEEEESDD